MSGLLKRFRARDRQALARILTHVENQSELGVSALQHIGRDTGNAHLVGLTGPPGTGKSTLANGLVREVRKRGRSIAVLAIDPSSPLSGGAALGDRIRMLNSQADDGVYIRSMASRGQVGGLAVSAFGAASVLDAFGFDVVIVETVGTGQDEVDIASLADTVVLLQTPGLGDSIQVTKAGVLEIADVLVVNKADLPDAEDLVHDLQQALRLGERRDWSPPVLSTIATTHSGLSDLADELERHLVYLIESGRIEPRRAGRVRHHARMLALGRLNQWLSHEKSVPGPADDDPVAMSEAYLREFAESLVSKSTPGRRNGASDSRQPD